MAILDCESYESALNSIATIYRASVPEIVRFLRRLDFDEELGGSSELLKERFESSFGAVLESLEAVRWFHLTRVPNGVDFADGILPLHLVRDRLWDAIISIPRETRVRTNLARMRQQGVQDFQYELKLDKLHSGPYAMLVRESAFHAEVLGNVDYLRMSETIEDICNGYETTLGENIFDEISRALRKCIVKFESNRDTDSYLIRPALTYCWCKANFAGLRRDVVATFDAGAEPIPPTDIIRVEFL